MLFLSLPPGPDGAFGLGAGADYAAALIGSARTVIAEVNDQVPDVRGDRRVRPEEIDVLVRVSRPVPEYPQPAARGPENAIAAHIAALIPDGATIQLGIGAIPSAVASRLRDHRDLGVHSGVITDAVADLIEAGVVTGSRKSRDRGLVITGFLWARGGCSTWPATPRRSSCATPATPTTRPCWQPSTGWWPSTRPSRST